jgi:large subunit ribosomal protein L23
MANRILLRPVVTEKAESVKAQNHYCFVVDKRANKIEIGKAVEANYNVNVLSVNTAVIPGKVKNKNTKRGLIKGRKSSFKKAYVTLTSGEEINFFPSDAPETTN